MSAEHYAEGRKRHATNQRARGTNPRELAANPRARATNPRARATNPHPGKSELTGQWRAAWRRLGKLPPDRAHEALKALAAEYRWLTGPERDALPAELRERIERLAETLHAD